MFENRVGNLGDTPNASSRFIFPDSSLLCSQGWLETLHLSASASWMLDGLQVHTITLIGFLLLCFV